MFNLQWTPENPTAQWFQASEAIRDDVGIRFGRLVEDSDEVEWFSISHCECDGIGGFARLLRSLGATIPVLPETKKPDCRILAPLWKHLVGSRRPANCATRKDWMPQGRCLPGVPNHVAWHVFNKEETRRILGRCRSRSVTVNSMLLKHLDTAVRPELGITKQPIPWMIPVNLRGDVSYAEDTENHVSCLDVLVTPDDSLESLHQQIRNRLDRGEHRAIHLLMRIGALAGQRLMVRYLAWDRTRDTGNIGAFSNLGSWDPATTTTTDDAWLFCPPVVLGQRLSAGCVTFRNRLSLMIQTHPYESTPQELTRLWMSRWIESIRAVCNEAESR